MTVTRTALTAVAGLALATVLALLIGKSAADTITLVGLAAGVAVAVGLLGAGLMHLLRHRQLVVSLTVVALTAVVAVAIGAWSAGRAMFFSSEDLDALSVVMIAAGTVAVCIALVLAERVAMSSRSLDEAATRIGAGDAVGNGQRPSIREFADLAQRLEDTAARLEVARAREQALGRSRRELVSWVSHDLRTPLARIRAVSEALGDGLAEDPETLARYHCTLRTEAERLGGLIDDLFELSRIQAGALRLQLERVSVADLVSDALAAAAPSAMAKGVRLEGRMDSAVPELRLSTREFGRVLGNLLDNAIRETPAGGAVAVTAGTHGEAVWVSVSDTCGGIDEADVPRVFDTAFRGERARTPTSETRAGLGLAIARGLVEAHRGEISVANTEDGCRFVVTVPVDPDVH